MKSKRSKLIKKDNSHNHKNKDMTKKMYPKPKILLLDLPLKNL